MAEICKNISRNVTVREDRPRLQKERRNGWRHWAGRVSGSGVTSVVAGGAQSRVGGCLHQHVSRADEHGATRYNEFP